MIFILYQNEVVFLQQNDSSNENPQKKILVKKLIFEVRTSFCDDLKLTHSILIKIYFFTLFTRKSGLK